MQNPAPVVNLGTKHLTIYRVSAKVVQDFFDPQREDGHHLYMFTSAEASQSVAKNSAGSSTASTT